MKRQNWYPSRIANQVLWLDNWYNKLIGYATILGMNPARLAAAIADARWLIYVLGTWLPAVRAWQKACTDAAAQAQTGDSGGAAMALPVFTPPPLPPATATLPAVVPVAAGALDRIFDLVAENKEADGYTDTMGLDMGVIGAAETGPDFATLQPILTATISGNQVNLGWDFQGFSKFLDQLEMQVDRGDGKGWVYLVSDTTPGYNDATPFPATPTKWKYRGIYRVDDAQVGLWSAEVSVIVGG